MDTSGRKRIRASLSLRPDQFAGIQRIAEDDLHKNFSRVVQDLIDDELRRRYGRDWSIVILGEMKESAVAA